MEGRIIVLVILALVLTEICLYINKIAGFVLYLLLIALYLLSLSQVKILNNYGKLIIILMIVPIVRVIELFITLEFFWKVVISYGVLLFLAFFYSVRFKLDHGHIKEKLGLFPFAVVVGVVLGFIGDAYFNFDKLFWLIYLIPFISYSSPFRLYFFIKHPSCLSLTKLFSLIFLQPVSFSAGRLNAS